MLMGMFLYFIQTQHMYFKQAKRTLINLPTLKKNSYCATTKSRSSVAYLYFMYYSK